MLSNTHQPERLVGSTAEAGRGWELRLGLWSDPRERTGVGCVNSLKGANASQLAGRESGKKSGTAEGARDHCFRVHEERGFRAPPKQDPEMARAMAIRADTRDRHEMLRLLLQPPRSLCASTGHSPHRPSQEPVQPATARVQ